MTLKRISNWVIAILFLATGNTSLTAQNSFAKQILLEKYTSVSCGSCGNGSLILEDLLQKYPKVIVAAIHCSVFDPMTIPAGMTSFKYYGNGTPIANVNRQTTASSSSTWEPRIKNAEDDRSMVKVELQNLTFDEATRRVDATVVATFADSLSSLGGPIPLNFALNLYIVENNVTGGVPYHQGNYFNNTVGHPHYGLGQPIPGFVHQHVLRAILGGPWGSNMGHKITEVAPGQLVTLDYSYVVPEDQNPYEIELIPLVQSYGPGFSDREILNANRTPLDIALNASGPFADEIGLTVYPNPGSGIFHFTLSGAGFNQVSLEIIDLQSRVIFQKSGSGDFVWNASGVADGVYLARLTANEHTFFRKVVVKK